MGWKEEVEETLKEHHVMKIDGTHQWQWRLNETWKQTSMMAVGIPTTTGVGMHGHVGMICKTE